MDDPAKYPLVILAEPDPTTGKTRYVAKDQDQYALGESSDAERIKRGISEENYSYNGVPGMIPGKPAKTYRQLIDRFSSSTASPPQSEQIRIPDGTGFDAVAMLASTVRPTVEPPLEWEQRGSEYFSQDGVFKISGSDSTGYRLEAIGPVERVAAPYHSVSAAQQAADWISDTLSDHGMNISQVGPGVLAVLRPTEIHPDR